MTSRAAAFANVVVLPSGVTRDVFVAGGRVTFTAPADPVTVASGGYLLPGLVDAHAHLALYSPAGDGAPAAERVRASARAHLDAGVLALREPGGPSHDSTGLGPSDGAPRVSAAGRLLARTGRYFPGLGREVDDADLADAAVEELAAGGGTWAKVVADWAGPGGNAEPSFSAGSFAEAVRRVHALGGRVAAHTGTRVGIEAAIAAGVDSLEHGLGLTDEHIDALVERGITLVPTMLAMTTALPQAAGGLAALGWGEAALAEVLASIGPHRDAVRRAVEAGVLVLAGTDAGMVPHGRVVDELRLLRAAGLPPVRVLGAGSWDARRFLGLPLVEEGVPADLVLYDGDPRESLDTLDRPRLAMLDGRVVAG
jgi:imidazolonepropionase-like amidohydrolase